MVDKVFTVLTSNSTAQKYHRLLPVSIHTQMNSQLSFYCPLQSIGRTPDNTRKAAAESQKRWPDRFHAVARAAADENPWAATKRIFLQQTEAGPEGEISRAARNSADGKTRAGARGNLRALGYSKCRGPTEARSRPERGQPNPQTRTEKSRERQKFLAAKSGLRPASAPKENQDWHGNRDLSNQHW
jgi:hypothetical protein